MNWHLITGEYPPQPGGVSDYTFHVAHGLVEAGETVTVWCPPWESEQEEAQPSGKVRVRRDLGKIGRGDLRRVDDLLNAEPVPRRLVVQWVPHAFSRRAINYPFCRWVRRRALRYGDEVIVMIHEAFLDISGSWKKRAAAVVQRLMMRELLASAKRAWVSTANWEQVIRPYAPRHLPISSLGVPSNIPVVANPAATAAVRARCLPTGRGMLVGHFGTYGGHTRELLAECLVRLCQMAEPPSILLMGRAGDAFREELLKSQRVSPERIMATGSLPPADLSLHLSACDLMIQPYEGGISTRNTSLMACLAHGLPVAATSGRLTEPLWNNNVAVLLSQEGEVDALCANIGRLLGDAMLRKRMGQAARQVYENCFAVERTVELIRTG